MIKPIPFLCLLLLLLSCGDHDENSKPGDTTTPETPNDMPAVIGYQLMNTYPHDSTAYTEGLQFIDGKLLESTGEYGQSDIRFSDLTTGKVLQKKALDKTFFGEGCTMLAGKIFQMTYRENTCFVYDANTLEKTDEFKYNFGEGWGMTTNGNELIISNGSSNIFFYDPNTFKEVKRLGITNQYGPVGNINELEMIKGYLYANVWQSDFIFKIDTSSGKVLGVVDMSDLRGKIGLPLMVQEDGKPEVLNGIAYDEASDRVFVTGKYWPKLCEIKFSN